MIALPANYSDSKFFVELARAARMTHRLMVRTLIVTMIRPASTKIHQFPVRCGAGEIPQNKISQW